MITSAVKTNGLCSGGAIRSNSKRCADSADRRLHVTKSVATVSKCCRRNDNARAIV